MLPRCSHSRIAGKARLVAGSTAYSFSNSSASFLKRRSTLRLPTRRCASTTSTPPKHAIHPSVPDSVVPLASLTNELDLIAPRFDIEAGDVEILKGPVEFYDVLKTKILNSKRRIYLSTLYIGKTEHELISTIRTALVNNADLKVSFLTDALRGTRETPEATTASLLAPLVTEFGSDRVQIRMYHTPNLVGVKKRIIPKRINEGWGLQHMKLYGFDDEIILSGANLSNDYFTNRLDRYHLFRSSELTNYYHQIHDAVSSISFDVQPSDNQAGYEISWPCDNVVPSPLDDPQEYRAHATALLTPLIKPKSRNTLPGETGVYPIFQFTPLFDLSGNKTGDASTELPALTGLFRTLSSTTVPIHTTFTAGYFNPSQALVASLLSSHSNSPTAKSSTTVIAASPYANGFYGSKGISGLLPPAYTLLCKRFLEEVTHRGLSGSVRLLEWRRGTVGSPGAWTYHAKGVWVTFLNTFGEQSASSIEAVGPSVTLIGSSNYTQRSYTLDLEANALVVTRDHALQKRLKEEEQWLQDDAKEVDLDEYRRTERRVGIHVRLAMWITKLVGGAL